ncbi:MAG: hypothetical protein H7123_06895, partial [Thermoleophilia bacterium]|nr:hypothetical protein [Thermoleophilia bacterium]
AYDPMLGKIITVGATRNDARLRLLEALGDVFVPGVVTNGTLLVHALELPDFIAARHDINTLTTNLLTPEALEPSPELMAGARRAQLGHAQADVHDPFVALTDWRLATQPQAEAAAVNVHPIAPPHYTVVGDRLWFALEGRTYDIARATVNRGSADGADHAGAADHATLTAPMPGTVLSALAAGATVRRGETVVTLEAMKMENAITAPFDGMVDAINCAAGDMVARGAVVAELTRVVLNTADTPATAEVTS